MEKQILNLLKGFKREDKKRILDNAINELKTSTSLNSYSKASIKKEVI